MPSLGSDWRQASLRMARRQGRGWGEPVTTTRESGGRDGWSRRRADRTGCTSSLRPGVGMAGLADSSRRTRTLLLVGRCSRGRGPEHGSGARAASGPYLRWAGWGCFVACRYSQCIHSSLAHRATLLQIGTFLLRFEAHHCPNADILPTRLPATRGDRATPASTRDDEGALRMNAPGDEHLQSSGVHESGSIPKGPRGRARAQALGRVSLASPRVSLAPLRPWRPSVLE